MKQTLKLVALKPEHAAIVPYLRRADVEEIDAMTGLSPAVAVAYSIAETERGYCALLDGKPCAVFGVAHGGVIWLVGTDEIARHPVTFYRVSRRIFPVLSAGYSSLENYVDARNTLSLRWLQWLGFEIGAPVPFGAGAFCSFHHVLWKEESNPCAQLH